MKKVFFLVAVIALTGISVLAQEWEQEQEQVQIQNPQGKKPIDLYLNFVNFSVGMHIPLAVEGSIELIRLGFEENELGFGASLSPFSFLGWVGGRMENVKNLKMNMGGSDDPGYGDGGDYGGDYGSKETNDSPKFAVAADWGVSFINPSVHWNAAPLLFPDVERFFLGPYADFSWLFMNPAEGKVDVERFRFSAGLKAGRRRGDRIKYDSFSVELGYLLDGNHTPPQLGNIQLGPNDHKFSVKLKFGR